VGCFIRGGSVDRVSVCQDRRCTASEEDMAGREMYVDSEVGEMDTNTQVSPIL